MISGIGSTLKQFFPHINIVGVEPNGAKGMTNSLKAGLPINKVQVNSIADSLCAPLHMPYSFNVAKKILEHFLNMLKEGSKLKTNSLSEDQNTTMMSLSGVKQFPMRVKCATLAWHTFMHAAEGKKETANTEKAD